MDAYQEEIKFNKVETQHQADRVQHEAPATDSGVFFMKETLGRGVDFKFAKNAYVVILNYDHHYRSSYVTQMIGRSNRDQGIQAGHVFCNDDMVMNEEPGFAFLQDRETKVGDDLGPELAGALTKLWDVIPSVH